ncbi:MAG: FG-GAP-like repeat-containing protein, partial [Thermoplasmatales archaeon]|nr:FG-GAP-like repeat-containing protein [Thermoplasmatales archaeon]
DGYDDVIVGAYKHNTTNIDAGKAYLYLGSASGLSTTPVWNSSGDDQAYAYYGYSVACAGDVNNDSHDDVIVGAYKYSTANASAGKAFLYLGSVSGLSNTPIWNSSGDDQLDAYYGYSVASAGDVNNDGYDDIIIGAYGYDTEKNTNAGKAYLYFGSSTGLGNTANWTNSSDDQLSAWYGNSVACAGDVNNDSYDDVIIGAYRYDATKSDAGKAYLYLGSASGLSPAWNSSGDDQSDAYYGYSVASAGDVNNDGYDDIIIGAYGYDTEKNTNAGKVYLYFGSSSPDNVSDWNSSGGEYFEQASAWYGCSVASAGDVNNDSYDDVIVGAYKYNTTTNIDAGKAYLYLGSASGLSTTPAWNSSGDDQADAWYGCSVASAGDVNNDGYDDVIVGAYKHNTTNIDAGKAYLYNGTNTKPRTYGVCVEGYEADTPNILNITSHFPMISWKYSDEEGSPQTNYNCSVWTGAGGTGVLMGYINTTGNSSSCAYSGAVLEHNTDYYARVQTKDNDKWSDWNETKFHTNFSATFSFTLSIGWNFISLPVENETISNAQALASLIGLNCTAVARWDNTSDRFVTHPAGTNISNFSVEVGIGYFVYVNGDSAFSISGKTISSKSITLKEGWNSAGRFNATETNASALGNSIDNCTHVAMWNNTFQQFATYKVGSGVNNFNVEQGMGYFVYVTKGSVWINQ